MICVHSLLLHVALTNRVSVSSGSANSRPFDGLGPDGASKRRPFDFWQWRPARAYWTFLAYYTAALMVLQVLNWGSSFYTQLQGYVGLSIEALLPIPQILSNQRSRSCKGFRLSVLVNWLFGDAMKMSFFFLATTDIPWSFKLCALFQACCDCYLGVQYWMFGEGPRESIELPNM